MAKSNITNLRFYYNQNQYTESLSSNVLSKVRANFNIEIDTSLRLKSGTFERNGALDGVTRTDGKSFILDGFSAGDNVTLYYIREDGSGGPGGGQKEVFETTVNKVSKDEITFHNLQFINVGEGHEVEDYDLIIVNKEPLTSCSLKYNLVQNDTNNITFKDYHNGVMREMYVSNITRQPLTKWHKFTVKGNKDGFSHWDTNIAFLQTKSKTYVQPTADPTDSRQEIADAIQVFNVNITFYIYPFLSATEDWSTNYENVIQPEFFLDTSSLKLAIEADFRKQFSNPNTSTIVKWSEQKGSVGWFNENYNGFKNNYKIESVEYFDHENGYKTSALDAGRRTKCVIKIKAENGFNTSAPFNLIHAWLPPLDHINNSNQNFENTYYYSNVEIKPGQAKMNQYVFGDVNCNLIDTNTAEIVFWNSFNTTQTNTLQEGYNYLLAVTCTNNAYADARQNDTVNLLADYNQYSKNTDIAGLFEVTSLDFFDYPSNGTAGFSNLEVSIEDAAIAKGQFTLTNRLHDTKNLQKYQEIKLNKLSFQILAVDKASNNAINENKYFVIQDYAADLTTNYVNLTKIEDFTLLKISYIEQFINFEEDRGFPRNGTNSDYWTTRIKTNSSNHNRTVYSFNFPFKLDWRNWISLDNRTNVPHEFYKTGEDFFGLNRNSSNYSNENNYEIVLAVKAEVSADNIVTDYYSLSSYFKVLDYTEQLEDAIDFSGEIKTFKQENSELHDIGGSILEGESTIIRAIFSRTDGQNIDSDKWDGIIRIEPERNMSMNIQECSTIKNVQGNDNILIPFTGENFARKYTENGKLIIECITDASNIKSGQNYKLSARIFATPTSENVRNMGSYNEDYNTDYDVTD